MPVDVIMPKVDMVMDEGTIDRWYKREGDDVKEGELLFDITTDKAVMEVESPASGVLGPITAPDGATVPVATVIATIWQAGETPVQSTARAAQPAVTPAAPFTMPTTQSSDRAPETAPTNGGPRPRATPLARSMAREHGVDLAMLTGSGAGGRLRKDDIVNAVEARRAAARPAADGEQQAVDPHSVAAAAQVPEAAPAPTTNRQPPTASSQFPTPAEGRLVPLAGIRKVIAQRMAVSATIPQFTLAMDVELSAAMQLRQRLPYRPSVTAIIARVVASVLPRHPFLNASFRDDGIWLHTPVHLGIALDSGGDLLVPVIPNAHQRTLSEIATALNTMRQRGEVKQFTPSELQGSTFTISNLGMLGVDHFTALVNPPEAAILAAGRSTQRAVEEAGVVVFKPLLTLTLSADHRVADGATAARFLQDVRAVLEEPLLLI